MIVGDEPYDSPSSRLIRLVGGVPPGVGFADLPANLAAYGLAADATSAYVCTSRGNLLRVPFATGVPTHLASGCSTFAIVVDATSVYWARGSAIWQTAK